MPMNAVAAERPMRRRGTVPVRTSQPAGTGAQARWLLIETTSPVR